MRRALALSVALILASAAPAHADGSLSIGVADGRSTYLIERVSRGHTVERHVRVGNTTARDLVVEVYAGAAANHRGTFRWGDGHAQNALTHWTSITPADATVPPNRAVDVTVTIRVPDGTPPGRHFAVVWAELPQAGNGVVNRVGVRIYLTVTEPSDSTTALVVGLAVLVLLVLAVSAIVAAARRRGSARGGSTTGSP